MIRNQARQWATSTEEASAHHIQRYKFAQCGSGKRILDAACGSGYGSRLLSEGGREVVGVDLSPSAIEWAREHFPGPTYICADIATSPWEGKFDTVVSLETIEHIKDPSPLLQSFRKACNGFFFASVPNEEKYPFDPRNYAKDEFPHFRHYTPDEFAELLESHGFEIWGRFCQVDKFVSPAIVQGTDGMFITYVCS